MSLILFTESKPLRESKALYRDLSARISADGGVISNPFMPQAFIREMARSGFLDFCEDHVVLSLPETRKMGDGTNIATMYNLFKSAQFDAVQDVASNQPQIGTGRNGKVGIAYQDGRRFEFLSNEALDFFRAKTYGLMGGVFDGNTGTGNMMFYSTTSVGAVKFRSGKQTGSLRVAARRLSADASIATLTTGFSTENFRSAVFVSNWGEGTGEIIVNGIQQAAGALTSAGTTSDDRAAIFYIGSRNGGQDSLDSNMMATFAINAQPPNGFLDTLNQLILTNYNLPVS